jgi:hypothetical protein
MDPQEHHEMMLAITHPSGAEEWYCPTCGRRFLLKWPPAYQKIILEPGDEYAAHSGSKGEILRLGSLELIDTGAPADIDDLLALPSPYRPADEDQLLSPPVDYQVAAEEIGDIPITDELQPWLKWLEHRDLDQRDDRPEQSG